MTATSERVKKLREKRGWTVRKLADELGVSAGFVTHLEQGQRHPSPETAKKLAALMGVKCWWTLTKGASKCA